MTNIKYYDTMADFLAACDRPAHPSWTGNRRSSRDTSNTAFNGGALYEDARKMATDGWDKGTQELSAKLAIIQAANTSRQMVDAIAGDRPNVGRFLAGLPDCMLRRDMTTSTRKPCVDVVVNASLSGGISAAELMNYGAAIAAAIDAMEAAGYSVALTVGAVSETHKVAGSPAHAQGCMVRIKDHGDQMDAGRIAYCVAHPSFLRRLCFSHWETEATSDQMGTGYGKIVDLPPDQRGTIYFGKASHIPCGSMTAAVDYVTSIIEKQSPDLLQAA